MSCAKSEGGTRLILLNVSNKTHSDRRINVNGFAAFCSLVANPVAGCTHTHTQTHTHAIYLAAISVSCSSVWLPLLFWLGDSNYACCTHRHKRLACNWDRDATHSATS